jgi:hypothetical protein
VKIEKVNYTEIMMMRYAESLKTLPSCDKEDELFQSVGLSTQIAPHFN